MTPGTGEDTHPGSHPPGSSELGSGTEGPFRGHGVPNTVSVSPKGVRAFGLTVGDRSGSKSP